MSPVSYTHLDVYKRQSILLAYELFGGQSLSLFALVIAISYMLSGYYGLYSEQKIVYSKPVSYTHLADILRAGALV